MKSLGMNSKELQQDSSFYFFFRPDVALQLIELAEECFEFRTKLLELESSLRRVKLGYKNIKEENLELYRILKENNIQLPVYK